MGKRVQIALAVLLVALVGVIAWQVLREREPVYQDKRLSFWQKGYTTGQIQEADEVVRQIGTNAIPTLLRLLQAKDSTWKLKFN